MISNGSVLITTGDDDLRENSQVWLRIYVRGRAPRVMEVAMRRRFADRTTVSAPWDLGADGPAPVEDIEKVEVAFVPDRREWMWDDQWWFTRFAFSVDDTGGPRELYRNDAVNRKFEWAGTWSTGILPTFTIHTGTLFVVRDEAGTPVEGAEVFGSSALLGRTDGQGQLHVPVSLDASERVVARKLVHEQDYYRGSHAVDARQNWNYRVHLTNLELGAGGVVSPIAVREGSTVTLPLSRRNTLIGLNLLLTLEWDATTAELDSYQQVLRDCSAYLYNATDGQFFIEMAQVYDQARHWDDSDYRCHADLGYRANVPNVVGGFLGWNVLGSAMKMARPDPGHVYAHEFGHFGFALRDEYSDGDPTVKCTAKLDELGEFGALTPMASCMMWNQLAATKICSSHPANPHRGGTRQGDEACWDTITRRYNRAGAPWQVLTPVDQGLHGPIVFADGSRAGGPFIDTRFLAVNTDLPNLVGASALRVVDSAGAPVTGLRVSTQDGSGRWITQGATGPLGQLSLAGIHVGDRIRLEGGSGLAYEWPIDGDPRDVTIVIR